MRSAGIELAVSLYSFTQRFVERDDYHVEDMFRTLHQLGVRQFEIVGSQVFDQYPRPRAREVTASWPPLRRTGARHSAMAAISTAVVSPARHQPTRT